VTVSNTVTYNTYTCDSSTTVFSYTFSILDSSHIHLYLIDNTTSPSTETEITSGFTVDTTNAQVTYSGASSYGSSYQIKVQRETPLTQEVVYTNGQAFYAATVGTSLDKLTYIGQENKREAVDAEGYATAAKTYAATASSAATTATTQATTATNQATIATTKATEAAASASAAAGSATTATTQATTATSQATISTNAATTATTQANLAADYATAAGASTYTDYTGTLKLLDLKTKGPYIDVRAFGAVGDGDSHPLSSYYSTLAEAQAVYSFATALTDEIDWCGIQAALNYIGLIRVQRGHLLIPPGSYIMSASLAIPPQGKPIYIQAKSAILTSNGFSGYMIGWTNSTTVEYPQYLTIDGLRLDGAYVSSGISITEANIWLLHNVTLVNCYVGLKLAGTYYGEISGESCIRDCYRCVLFTSGSTKEINTIKFNNVKMDSSVSVSKFEAQGSSETSANYALRCTSQAFRIECMLNAVDFAGCIIEGYDYGFWGFYTSGLTTTGTSTSIFSITKCYFENIGKQAIALAGISVDSDTGIETLVSSDSVSLRIIPTVMLEGNRFASATSGACTLAAGKYRVFNNETYMNLYMLTGAYQTNIYTDINPSKITSSSAFGDYQTLYINSTFSYSAVKNMQYGISSVDRTTDWNSTLRTIEDNNMMVNKYLLSDVRNITTRPVTFETLDGEYNGPIIKSPSGYYAMITVDDSFNITAKQITNLALLKRVWGDYFPEELYKLRNSTTTSTAYNCLAMLDGYNTNTLTLSSGGYWLFTSGARSGFPYFGTAAELSTYAYPSGWKVYELQTKSVFRATGTAGKYYWYSDVFGVYDSTRTIISMGTYANMPTASSTYNGNIYYAYDTNAFYKCVSGAWASYTPAFTTPSVSSVSATSTAITVTFNKAISSASCTSSTITLTDTTTSTAITCTYSVSSNVLTITPASTLTSGDSFSLAITGDVYDTTYELNKMGRPYSTTFTIS